jgi:transcriptional regulator with XRE-family HTH domain
MATRTSATPGGAKLRFLREQSHRTQLWVEAEAELGTGYLQRLESGRVLQPEQPTLERILGALAVSYSERKELLELFGYTVPVLPPEPAEIEWARAVSRRELNEVPFPAYTIDCALRLIGWNGYFPCLLGLRPADPLPSALTRENFLGAWFEASSPLARLLAEPDDVRHALITALRYEIRQIGPAPWHAEMIERLRLIPAFRNVWDAESSTPLPVSAARALVPLTFDVPGVGRLRFRLSAEPFLRDSRFRILYYFPADPATMQQGAAWSVVQEMEQRD